MLFLGCTVGTVWWIRTTPEEASGGFIELDGRAVLAILATAACFVAALVATVGGGRRASIGWICFVACLLIIKIF